VAGLAGDFPALSARRRGLRFVVDERRQLPAACGSPCSMAGI
jgi:hypothetical protein